MKALDECIDVLNRKENSFRKRIDKELERRKKLETKLKAMAIDTPSPTKYVVMGSPDYEVIPKT